MALDLVAESIQPIEAPEQRELHGQVLSVDTVHEILVNKLVALVGRSELRDLVDACVLLDRGGDLPRALSEAPRKDAGFSPLILAWLLHDMPVERKGRADGRSTEEIERLLVLRRDLAARVSDLSDPRH